MKKTLTKTFAVTSILFSLCSYNRVQARTGVGHGGGGEWNVIKCTASTKSTQKLSLTVCLTGELNHYDQYDLIPCGQDSTPQITIQRYTQVESRSRVSETTKIPGHLFSADWSKIGFFLRMKNSSVGELNLSSFGTSRLNKEATLYLHLPSMKYNLRNVSCEFGSN
jgi:hypothetical protein